VKRLRGGLVFKAHRLVYHSAPGWRVVKKKKKDLPGSTQVFGAEELWFQVMR